MLKAHQEKCGLEQSRVCECGQGIDDLEHFILKCPRHQEARKDLKKAVMDIWTASRNEGNLISQYRYYLYQIQTIDWVPLIALIFWLLCSSLVYYQIRPSSVSESLPSLTKHIIEKLYYYLKHCRSCHDFVLSSSSASMVSDWIVVWLHYASAASHGITLALPSAWMMNETS